MSAGDVVGAVVLYVFTGAMLGVTVLSCAARTADALFRLPIRPRSAVIFLYFAAWPLVAPPAIAAGLVYVARGAGDLYRMWRPAKPELPTATARKVRP